jgi:hypothetical protein
LIRFFIANLISEGIPAFLIIGAVWLFARTAGTHAVQFWRALLLSTEFGVMVAALQCLLFLVSNKVVVTNTRLRIGARTWRNKAIRKYAWESGDIGDAVRVLVFTNRISERIRVAVPADISPDVVEQALSSAGIPKMTD